MTEYGIRLPEGRIITGPGWGCVADVVGSVHYHDLPLAADHGDLVVRESDDQPWRDVTM